MPAGCHTVSPYLSVWAVQRCFDFCRAAFRAEVLERIESADGALRHAQVKIMAAQGR